MKESTKSKNVKEKIKKTFTEKNKWIDGSMERKKPFLNMDYLENFNTRYVNFSTRTIIKFRCIGLGFVFLGYLFFSTLNVLYMILTALIISVSMEGIVVAFEKKIKQREVAIWISYFLLILFLLSWIILIVPFIISQLTNLIERFSWAIVDLKVFITGNSWPEAINQISWLPSFLKEYLVAHWSELDIDTSWLQSTLLSGLNTLLDTSVLYLKHVSSWILTFIWSFFSVLWQLILTFTLAIFLSVEKTYVIDVFVKCFSQKRKPLVYEKINSMYDQLSIWLRARLLLSLFLAIMIWIVLRILNICWITIPSIFTLSVITGLLDIVPYVWPLFAAIPIAILAFVHNGFWAMILVWVLFILIQWIQENIISPVLMWKQLGVNSVLILISALLWAVILGFWWFVLSVPLAVVIGLFIDGKGTSAWKE